MRRYGFVRPLSFLGRLKPFFSFWQRKKRMGSKSVPLGAKETGRSGRTESSAPTRCGGRYAAATMHCNCSLTLIRLLRRHLPRRGRQSAAAGIGRTGSSAPTGAVENRRNGSPLLSNEKAVSGQETALGVIPELRRQIYKPTRRGTDGRRNSGCTD